MSDVIHFSSKPITIGATMLVLLPKEQSDKLPSRGMALVSGSINGYRFTTPLEPDGRGSHWLKLDETMRQGAAINDGDSVELEIAPSKDWPEPAIPSDVKSALADDKEGAAIWGDITPMARWDWLRWINSTDNPETRKRRVRVALSKMKAGTRRPCCFNRSLCTDPSVSKGGALLKPSTTITAA